jgi:hypothetical protein
MSSGQSDRNSKLISEIKTGVRSWAILSHYGVVRIDTPGLVASMNSIEARAFAEYLRAALLCAADSVDRASMGGQR